MKHILNFNHISLCFAFGLISLMSSCALTPMTLSRSPAARGPINYNHNSTCIDFLTSAILHKKVWNTALSIFTNTSLSDGLMSSDYFDKISRYNWELIGEEISQCPDSQCFLRLFEKVFSELRSPLSANIVDKYLLIDGHWILKKGLIEIEIQNPRAQNSPYLLYADLEMFKGLNRSNKLPVTYLANSFANSQPSTSNSSIAFFPNPKTLFTGVFSEEDIEYLFQRNFTIPNTRIQTLRGNALGSPLEISYLRTQSLLYFLRVAKTQFQVHGRIHPSVRDEIQSIIKKTLDILPNQAMHLRRALQVEMPNAFGPKYSINISNAPNNPSDVYVLFNDLEIEIVLSSADLDNPKLKPTDKMYSRGKLKTFKIAQNKISAYLMTFETLQRTLSSLDYDGLFSSSTHLEALLRDLLKIEF